MRLRTDGDADALRDLVAKELEGVDSASVVEGEVMVADPRRPTACCRG